MAKVDWQLYAGLMGPGEGAACTAKVQSFLERRPADASVTNSDVKKCKVTGEKPLRYV